MDSSRVMCLRHCLISGRLALWTRNNRLWARTARGFQYAAAAQTAGTAQPAKQKGSNNNAAKAGVENTSSESDQKALRLEKIEQLRSTGVEPFAYSFGVSHTASELQQTYQDLPNGELADLDGSPIAVAGRIMTRRFLGKKLAFFTLQDATGTIQLYIEKGLMESDSPMPFGDLKQVLDNGDIIGVQGGMKRTDKGELSVAAKSIHMLTKSLLPLPEKYYGFGEDTENRFRNRYVDMIVTEGVRAALRTRAQVSVCMRRVLDEQGFIEIETPMLEASAGGADARPFVTWHNALQRPYVLRIATELRLKRCLVGGFDKVYEIGRIFRNEGLSSRHNPEFTSIELYQAFVDYHAMMDLTEHLIRSCAKAAFPAGISSIPYQEHTLDLEAPFRKASMQELVQEATGLDFSAFSGDVEAAKAAASEMLERREREVPEGDQQSSVASSRKNVAQASSVGEVLNECFEACVEQTLTQPTFVLDHPVEISPLAKAHRSKPGCVERFELFVAGRELANAFSELTDPVEQRRRLEAQVTAHRRAGGAVPSDDAQPSSSASAGGFGGSQEAPYEVTVDEDFLRALEVGMPPAAGMGLGIDRLVMLLTNASSIKEVIAFPLMR